MNNTDARASCFQLLALGFAHPLADFYPHLESGEYSRVLALQADAATGDILPVCMASGVFEDFEAEYIRLFQVGHRGRPCVPLNAADYDDLLAGGDRPQFLLRYSQWYRHFGLKIAEEGDNLLPDHLVCQLEFMAWLAQLEHRAEAGSDLEQGYRRAQVDFLQKELLPMLPPLLSALSKEARDGECAKFFLALGQSLELVTTETLGLLLEQAPPPQRQDDTIEAVNLWE